MGWGNLEIGRAGNILHHLAGNLIVELDQGSLLGWLRLDVGKFIAQTDL